MKTKLDRLVWLYKERQKVPATPHMSFQHGSHGYETYESNKRRYQYDIRMEQWRIINRVFYKELKEINKYEINHKYYKDIYRAEFSKHLLFRIEYVKDIPIGLLIILKGLYAKNK